jgi:uncharacterized membrane protein YdfJ with MMPL/SSD domain
VPLHVLSAPRGYLPTAISVLAESDPTKLKLMVEIGVWEAPLSAKGMKWLVSTRKSFAQVLSAKEYTGVEGWIGGGFAEDYDKRVDLIGRVYSHFPLTVAYVAGVVFVLMILSFGSIMIAVKAVVSIALTLSIVYGARFFRQIYARG